MFYRCKFSPRLQIRLLFRKTAARIAASERYWRLPSSPIVEKNILKMSHGRSYRGCLQACKLYFFDRQRSFLDNKTPCRFTQQIVPIPTITITLNVTVDNVNGTNIYVINGVNKPVLEMNRGTTYIFDLSGEKSDQLH